MRRRHLLLATTGSALALGGCADAPVAPSVPAGPLTRARVVSGGFLTPPLVPGATPRPGTGMFAKLVAPAALALRGADLLVVDPGTQRVWRIDPAFGHANALPGVAATPLTSVALAADRSAWVLDGAARQVLRIAYDGRLLQTYAVPTEMPSPVDLALADGGATLLLADGLGAQWSEQRSPSGPVRRFAPGGSGERRVGGVDAIASFGNELFVLDRLGAAVHRCTRDGQVLATLGRGELVQPSRLAVDRSGRVFVVDAGERALVVLAEGRPARRFSAAELNLQRIGGLAIDETVLALSDTLLGQVSMFLIAQGAWT